MNLRWRFTTWLLRGPYDNLKTNYLHMKKIFILGVFGLTFLSSCNKAYTCTCVVTGTVDVEHYTLYNSKKKATKMCNSHNDSGHSCVLEAY